MALEQYKRNCAFFDKKPDDTEESLAYDLFEVERTLRMALRRLEGVTRRLR